MDSIEPPSTPEDPETDLEVERILGSDESLAYGLHSKLKMYGYHYNSEKWKCKRLAVTWIVAAFIGYGYVLSGQEAALPFGKWIAIVLMSYLASSGIMLLGFLDLVVYQRAIESIVLNTAELEKKHRCLPNTHVSLGMLLLAKSRTGPVRFDAWFYLTVTTVLMVVAGYGLWEIGRAYGLTIGALLAAAGGALIVGLWILGGVTARSSALVTLHGEGHVPHKQKKRRSDNNDIMGDNI